MSNEIFEVVKKHLVDICPDIDAALVVPEASMKDLGASSLDMVEVVSCSMRELGVRVPRQELSTIKDIGGLVELLQVSAAAKSNLQ
jgi:acyl carrier protein